MSFCSQVPFLSSFLGPSPSWGRWLVRGGWGWVSGQGVGEEADPLPRDGYCLGRYASYWNPFLFLFISMQFREKIAKILRKHLVNPVTHESLVGTFAFRPAIRATLNFAHSALFFEFHVGEFPFLPSLQTHTWSTRARR